MPWAMKGASRHSTFKPVGKSATAVKVKARDKGVDLCLVKGQGHHFRLTVNGAIFGQQSTKNFRGTLKTRESLAQKIFSRLLYS